MLPSPRGSSFLTTLQDHPDFQRRRLISKQLGQNRDSAHSLIGYVQISKGRITGLAASI